MPQPPPDYEAWRRGLEEWKERNARLGIDQDIAKREDELKERAKLLAVGMTPEQVIEVMGKPDHISGLFIEGTNWVGKIIELEDLPKYAGKIKDFGFDYTPYPVADFLRLQQKTLRIQLYQNLSVSFDENQQVKWFYWR